MLKALNTGASAVSAQQAALDIIGNNVANVNTPGFKESRPDFADLVYRQVRADQPAGQAPVVGQGVRLAGSQTVFYQGRLLETGRQLDLAIAGEGFFQLTMPNGEKAFTRDGVLQVDAGGRLAASGGQVLDPEVRIPAGAEISITEDGRVLVKDSQNSGFNQVGQISLTTFTNPAALSKIGDSLYQSNQNSGEPATGIPGSADFGTLRSGFLEGANVDLANALTALIGVQRAYQFNTKVISNADQMLGIANDLRR